MRREPTGGEAGRPVHVIDRYRGGERGRMRGGNAPPARPGSRYMSLTGTGTTAEPGCAGNPPAARPAARYLSLTSTGNAPAGAVRDTRKDTSERNARYVSLTGTAAATQAGSAGNAPAARPGARYLSLASTGKAPAARPDARYMSLTGTGRNRRWSGLGQAMEGVRRGRRCRCLRPSSMGLARPGSWRNTAGAGGLYYGCAPDCGLGGRKCQDGLPYCS